MSTAITERTQILELIDKFKEKYAGGTSEGSRIVCAALNELSLLIQKRNENELNLKPIDPLAKTLADLVTPKQHIAIRAIANSKSIDAETECREVLKCRVDELSRSAASYFINHLKSARPNEARKAG